MLSVQDSEVKADRSVSPKQMKKQQAEQMEAAARSSDLQQAVALRGVRQMLGDQGSRQGVAHAQTQVSSPPQLPSVLYLRVDQSSNAACSHVQHNL